MNRCILLMFMALVHMQEVQADIGPKPTVDFLIAENSGLQLIRGELLQCGQADCSDARPLERVGPQRFGCTNEGCFGMAYGFAPYMQLRLAFENGKQLTNPVFQKKAFDARFSVIVTGETIHVTEQ